MPQRDLRDDDSARSPEEGHRLSRRLRDAFFDALPTSIAVLDAAGTIVAVNAPWRRFAAANGLTSPHDGVGLNYITVCESTAGAERDEALRAAAGIRDVLECRREGFYLEYSCDSPNQQRWFSMRAQRFGDEATHTLVSHDNITARKQAEIAALSSQMRNAAILESAADAIFTLDGAGLVETFNPAAEQMFGIGAHEMIGQSISRLVPGLLGDGTGKPTPSPGAAGTSVAIRTGEELEGSHRDGGWIPLDLTVSEFREGDRVRYVGIARDISLRKRSDQLLRQQEKLAAVGQLSAGLAHEIGNPLASISAIAQNLERKLGDPAQREKLHLIQTHIHRVTDIVRHLVDFARPAEGDWEVCDVHEILDEALEMVRHDRRARDVEIGLRLARSLPRIRALADPLEQVFVNLALNAFDALQMLPEHARRCLVVSTRSRDDDGLLEIVFEDSGPGISADRLEQIFEPFYTTKDVGKGTGLGLAVSYGIVREHGGSIRAESPTGGGARFVIEIPTTTRGEREPDA